MHSSKCWHLTSTLETSFAPFTMSTALTTHVAINSIPGDPLNIPQSACKSVLATHRSIREIAFISKLLFLRFPKSTWSRAFHNIYFHPFVQSAKSPPIALLWIAKACSVGSIRNDEATSVLIADVWHDSQPCSGRRVEMCGKFFFWFKSQKVWTWIDLP